MCDPPSFAEKEFARGLEALRLGHLDEAVPALEAAAEGIVDANEPLGRVYRLQGRYRDAERAWLRVLRYSVSFSLRLKAVQHLADLYGHLGGRGAREDLLAYRQAMTATSQPDVPPERIRRRRIRRRGKSPYYVKGSDRGSHGARPWLRLVRGLAIVAAGIATFLGIAQGIDWLWQRYF
jgi:tetratricopeptide (TPR) repeat protein